MRNKLISLCLCSTLGLMTPLNYVTPDKPMVSSVTNQVASEEKSVPFDLKDNVCTEKDSKYTMTETTYFGSPYYGLHCKTDHGDWAEVPELINFVDRNNCLYLAYTNATTLFIEQMSEDFTSSTTLSIDKKFSLLGDVLCDDDGNFYVVWGQEDTVGNGGCTTMAVSKYDCNGLHLDTTEFVSSPSAYLNSYQQTKTPFVTGSCDTLISNGVLIVNYARLMYNGHQSNNVLAVNIADMSVNHSYTNYVSHSFDQRVLALEDGSIAYANQGDAYPRGFTVGTGTKTYFHFYGDIGDNNTYAQLGDLCEFGNKIIYSGTAPKSLDAGVEAEATNLFCQIASDTEAFSTGDTREGTSGGSSVTDKGILWVTDYEGTISARNPQMVKISNSRFILLWEKFEEDRFMETCYKVLDCKGNSTSDEVSLGDIRLNTFEPPVLIEDNIVWVTAGYYEQAQNEINYSFYFGYKVANGNKAIIHSIDLGQYTGVTEDLTTPIISIVPSVTPTVAPSSVTKIPAEDNNDANKKKNTLKNNMKFSVGKCVYRVTSVKNKQVSLLKTIDKKITSLKVKDYVTYKNTKLKVVSIEKNAFKGCKKLKSVIVGDNVKTIGKAAFRDCTKLRTVRLGRNLATIGDQAFYRASSLKSIEFKGTKLKSVGKKAFKGTSKLKKVKIPKSKVKAYKKLLRNKGLPVKIIITYK